MFPLLDLSRWKSNFSVRLEQPRDSRMESELDNNRKEKRNARTRSQLPGPGPLVSKFLDNNDTYPPSNL